MSSGPYDWEIPPQGEQEKDEPTHLEKLRAALLDSAGLDSIAKPEPLIHGLLYLNSLNWLQGKPGHGKSFVALDWAGCVGTGETWQGYLTKQGPVLYLIAEGASGMTQRVRAWEHAMGHGMAGVKFLPVAVQATNGAQWQAFCDLAAELSPVLVVIDTQARVTVGMEENGSKDMGVFVDKAERLRVATGAAVLVIHHQGRSGEHMRGSSALDGAATTIARAEKEDDRVTVECVKQKDAPEFEPIELRLIPTEESAILALTRSTPTDHIGQALKSPWIKVWWERFESDQVSVSGLVKAEVVTEATFHRHKNALIKAGLVAKEGTDKQTRYRLKKDPSQ